MCCPSVSVSYSSRWLSACLLSGACAHRLIETVEGNRSSINSDCIQRSLGYSVRSLLYDRDLNWPMSCSLFILSSCFFAVLKEKLMLHFKDGFVPYLSV